MKNILLKIILSVLLAISFTSCNNWLELYPEDDLVSEEFWKSQEDVEAVLASTYGQFASQVKTLLLWGELRGGLLSDGQRVPSDASKIIKGDITDQNGLLSWAGLYKVINGANQILKFAPDVVSLDPSFTSAELKQIKSEALFLRSLSYFYLVRTFKEVPLSTEPYVSDEQDYYPAKSPEDAILQQMITDLTEALDGAATSFETLEGTKGRATIHAIHALLADVYLWNDEYSNAVIHCDEIINSPGFALLGPNSWFQNFYPGNSNSSVYEVQFSKSWGYSNSLYETFSYQRDKEYIINPRILEDFTPSDVRGQGTTYSIKNLELWKYVGINPTEERGDELDDNNFIIYRLADIMLLKAEALAELQDFDGSLALINAVRAKRSIEATSIEPKTDAFQAAILEERARELAGEGKYWYDLVRIGKRDNYRNKQITISALTSNATADAVPALTAKFQDPYSWYMPIYNGELQINTNLEQNPYYKN